MNQNTKYASQVVYFEKEGNDNLGDVIQIIKRTLKRREDLRALKLVIFTASGRGPWLAYSQIGDKISNIVAVTFPLDFCVPQQGGAAFYPRIDDKVQKFFDGVGIITVPRAPLLFDAVDGLDQHNAQLKTVKDAIAIFGGGLNYCIQAVVRACDAGVIEAGERLIAMAGDCAAIMTASTSSKFLSPDGGVAVHEILCKARYLTIARPTAKKPVPEAQASFPIVEAKVLPSE